MEQESKQWMKRMGEQLRLMRKDKQLSLEELANQTGISKLTLGNIERGETNPTMGVIWKIAKGLSVPLTSLFTVEPDVYVSRAREGIRLDEDGEAWSTEPIFGAQQGMYELYRVYVGPEQTYEREGHHPDSTEIVTVMHGTITIDVSGESIVLQAYDSIRFRADEPHRYSNATNETAVLHIVVQYKPRLP